MAVTNNDRGMNMEKKTLAAFVAVGMTAAIAIPAIAFGNARRTDPAGSLSLLRDEQTPLIAQLAGANEVPGPGDTAASGAASVTFEITDPTDTTGVGAQVCWDTSASGITPVAGHIHPGAVGVANPPVIKFENPVSKAFLPSGCADVAGTLAAQIVASPKDFYVNLHTAAFPNGAVRGQLAAGPPPAGEAHLLDEPLRAYDSRDKTGPKIAAGETRTISLATGKTGAGLTAIAVPPGATGALVTLTVTETTGNGGFLKMYNASLPSQPATSSINWAGVDQNVAVSTQVSVDATGSVKVIAGANATHFVIDVVGYTF
jgi:CHRD domain